jgi:hypothetical protein
MALEHVLAKKEELTWNIYEDSEDWIDDLSTDAPCGSFEVICMMADYRQDNYDERKWRSTTKVVVADQKIDQDTALAAVAEIMLASGYFGCFIENFDFDYDTNTFEVVMGS